MICMLLFSKMGLSALDSRVGSKPKTSLAHRMSEESQFQNLIKRELALFRLDRFSFHLISHAFASQFVDGFADYSFCQDPLFFFNYDRDG